MTPDPIPHAPESASEVLRSLEWAGKSSFGPFCLVCGGRASFGVHTSACRLAAALADQTPSPSGDELAELRAKLRSAEATIAKALARETQAFDSFVVAEARVKVLEEALKPFGAWSLGDLLDVSQYAIAYTDGNRSLTVGDFRRARAALAQHQKGNGHGE